MYQEVALKMLPGILVAVFSSFLAARWATKKFYTEKWWERKEKAYTEIINSLYDMVQFYEVFKEDYGQDNFISEARSHELHQRHTKAYWTVRRATDLASLYVSNEAIIVLKTLREREVFDYETNPLWDIYDSEHKHHSQALNKLILIASKDLKGK
ncbi:MULTISPECIES: hypothetical protein [Vibrio]|uniref:hypothetical protein n=1 Tax=Vibrio TaxID=662 RepID=UPI000769CFE7|nr:MULTISPECIES: hypothetical protein [Vibrio]ELV8853851.1 hypothetical protein [Vibrio fluvialis]